VLSQPVHFFPLLLAFQFSPSSRWGQQESCWVGADLPGRVNRAHTSKQVT